MLVLTEHNIVQQNQYQQKMKNLSSNQQLKFKKLNDAVKKIPQGYTLFRNEQDANFVFEMMNDTQILDIIRKKNQSLHLHEILGQFCKIFFDLDLKIEDVLINNELVINYILTHHGLQNFRNGEFDTIQDELFIKNKQGSLLECFIIYQVQRLISCKFAQSFKQIEDEYYILDNSDNTIYLDTLFDAFRSSRSCNNQTKISWHFTFIPDMYCMEIRNMKKISQEINNNINNFFTKFFESLNKNLKQHGFNELIIKDCIDLQVYKKNGSIRFVNCLKRKETTGIKKFIESNKNMKNFKNANFCDQLPARFLISKIQTQQGDPLTILTYDESLYSSQSNQDQQDDILTVRFDQCPLSEKDIQRILIKQNIYNAILDKPQQQGDIFHLRIKNKFKTCILCDRVHDSDNMYAIINNKIQYIEIRCFRRKGDQGLRLDYQGNPFGIGQDINDIHKNMPDILNQDDTLRLDTKSDLSIQKHDKLDKLDKTGKTSQIKQQEIIKLNQGYFQKYENINLNDFNIDIQETNISELQEFPTNFKKLYIKSHMGTAKTKRLLSYLYNYIQKYPKNVIYIMSFRITFAEDLTNKINIYLESRGSTARFMSYLSLKNHRMFSQQYLIVQVESLNKINIQKYPCDLLILDESESIFEQLSSSLSQKESVNFSIFVELTKQAKQIICMDAYLSQRTIQLIEYYSRQKHSNSANPVFMNQFQLTNQIQLTNSSCQIEEIDEIDEIGEIGEKLPESQQGSIMIRNVWQHQKTYILYQSQQKQNLWLSDLLQAYQDGENIVVPCNNATVAETVYNLISSMVSEQERSTLQIYTQKLNKQEKERDLLDLNESWKKYRILIYSPTISAGISYELSHFNRVFAYFDIRSTNLETFFQMMGRVRNISSNSYHILLTGGQIYNPCFLDQIHKQTIENINSSCQMIPAGLFFTYENNLIVIENNDYYQLILHNTRVKNLTTSSPMQRFIFLAGNNSIIKIRSPLKGIIYQYNLLTLVNDLRTHKFNQMKSAPILSQINDQSQQFEIEKYNNMKAMGISKENSHYFEHLSQESHMLQWIRKYRYVRFRLQYGQFKQYIKFQKQMTQTTQFNDNEKMDIIRDIIANSQERLLELILQLMGLNWDILDIYSCKQHSITNKDKINRNECSCNKQLILNLSNSIKQFLNNHSQITAVCKYIKSLQIPMAKQICRILLKSAQNAKYNTYIDKSVKLTIKTFKRFLTNYFGLSLIKYHKYFVIIKHSNSFDTFLIDYLIQKQYKQLNTHTLYPQNSYFKIQKLFIHYLLNNQYINCLLSSDSFAQQFESNILPIINHNNDDSSDFQSQQTQLQLVQNCHKEIDQLWNIKNIKITINQLEQVRSKEDLYNLLVYLSDFPYFVNFTQLLYLTGYIIRKQQENNHINYASLLQDYNYYNNINDLITSIKQSVLDIDNDFNDDRNIHSHM